MLTARPGTGQVGKVLRPPLQVVSDILTCEAGEVKQFAEGHKTNSRLRPGLEPRCLLLCLILKCLPSCHEFEYLVLLALAALTPAWQTLLLPAVL